MAGEKDATGGGGSSSAAFVFCQPPAAGTAQQPRHPYLQSLAAADPTSAGISSEDGSTKGDGSSFQQSSTVVATEDDNSPSHGIGASKPSDWASSADLQGESKASNNASDGSPQDIVVTLESAKGGSERSTKQKKSGAAPEGTSQSIYLADDDVLLFMRFYEGSLFRLGLWYLGCVLSVGILVVIGHWYPGFWLAFNTRPTRLSARDIEKKRRSPFYVAVAAGKNSVDVCRVQKRKLQESVSPALVFPPSMKIPPTEPQDTPTPLPIFVPQSEIRENLAAPDLEIVEDIKTSSVIELDYRSTRFLLHSSGSFVLLSEWRDPTWVSASKLAEGVGPERRAILTDLLGPNLIDLKGRSIPEIFLTEALHPFNIFQIYSIILWCTDDYVPYAIVIAVITIIGMALTVIETKRSIARMRKMSRFVCKVKRLRRIDNRAAAAASAEEEEKVDRMHKSKRQGAVWDLVESTTLVPGDVIDLAAVDGGKIDTVPCDLLLLDSDAIVSEAMLTGESVPVAKSGVPGADVPQLQTATRGSRFDRYCVFGGTQLVRARPADEKDGSEARAVVIQTGFNTAKGSLIRQMLFPREITFKFYRDSFIAIGVLFGLAMLGLIASVVYFVHIGVDPAEIAVRSLDVLTISVPPALPAALSIAITFALARLRSRQIFCTSPQRINVAGMVTAAVFDKTGTLTEEGLSVLGICFPTEKSLGEPVKTHEELVALRVKQSPDSLSLENALATTHDLNYYNGNLLGEPLEASMFQWTGASLLQEEAALMLDAETPALSRDGRPVRSKIVETILPARDEKIDNDGKCRLAIVWQFEFVAALRRMSVIVKRETDPATYIFVKGAAESIGGLCRQDTFPPGYEGQVDRWTHGGYRVLALAGKRLEDADWQTIRSMKRGAAESDLTFLGLLVFENKLKEGSTSTLALLREGGIITKMCTGDAPLTAISVARECNLVSSDKPVFMARVSGSSSEDEASSHRGTVEWVDVDDQKNVLDEYSLQPMKSGLSLGDVGLCVSGDTYAHIMAHSKQDSLERLLVQGQVFARFSPEQKQDLVERLQGINYTVAMIGDGANDMGALKSADVGLSLSQAEASVAAPFTSEKIQAIEELCREGRNAVTSSVSLFNFFFIYGLTEYFTVLLLYGAPFFSTTMNNAEYLYIDIFLVFPFVFGISASRPSLRLVAKSVRTRIITRRNLTSIICQMILMLMALMTTYLALHRQSFYMPPDYDPEDIVTYSQDNTSIFRTSTFTYLIVALVWNLGPPHRRILPRNYLLSAAVIVLAVFNFYFLFCTGGGLFDLFELEASVPQSFSFILLGIVLAQASFSIAIELFCVDAIARFLFKPVRAVRRWYTQKIHHRPAPPENKRYVTVAKGIRNSKQVAAR